MAAAACVRIDDLPAVCSPRAEATARTAEEAAAKAAAAEKTATSIGDAGIDSTAVVDNTADEVVVKLSTTKVQNSSNAAVSSFSDGAAEVIAAAAEAHTEREDGAASGPLTTQTGSYMTTATTTADREDLEKRAVTLAEKNVGSEDCEKEVFSEDVSSEEDTSDPIISEELMFLNFPELSFSSFFSAVSQNPPFSSQQHNSTKIGTDLAAALAATAAASAEAPAANRIASTVCAAWLSAENATKEGEAISELQQRQQNPAESTCVKNIIRTSDNGIESTPASAVNIDSPISNSSTSDSTSATTAVNSVSNAALNKHCTVQLYDIDSAQPLALINGCLPFAGRFAPDAALETLVFLNLKEQHQHQQQRRPHHEEQQEDERHWKKRGRCSVETAEEGEAELLVEGLTQRKIDFIIDSEAAAAARATTLAQSSSSTSNSIAMDVAVEDKHST